MAQQKMSVIDFDIAEIREAKRLLRRGLKKLEKIEKDWMKRRAELREEWRDRGHRRREKARAPEVEALLGGDPVEAVREERAKALAAGITASPLP